MYNFIDVNEVSEVAALPSEALKINGDYLENLIPGYRTLQVIGREALTAELLTYETGVRDGSTLVSKRYPARYITIKYQLKAESPEAFRSAFNQLASALNVEEAELIFNDEPDKFFIGTPEEMGEVPGGLNSVTSEFTIFCADPFKYSVLEYEAEPSTADNSFLIDYNGTYKAFPTLEAEFFSEDEGRGALTGNGDCGYVAFFNENEKIIQLGNPDETDIETYPPSQTLVDQLFQTETAWGTIAQTNWAMNSGKISSSEFPQLGSVAMKPASYAVTNAPLTSGTLLSATSKAARPFVNYKVTAQAYGRTADRAKIKVTIVASLAETTNAGTTTATAGAKVTLNKTKVYTSATATSSSGTKTGTFYLWDSSTKSGRIRITNTASNVGKSGQVTGWVNVSDINLSAASNALGTAYGLKGAIQFASGDWNYVTIKSEGSSWKSNCSYTTMLLVEVKSIDANTTLLEDIKFKVERTDDEDNEIGKLDETRCNDLEISVYTAPVVDSWFLMPETYGTGSKWHGPSITRTLPADDSGEVGAVNCTFTFRPKLSIGSGSSATQELGEFQALLVSGSGSNRKIVAGINVYKGAVGSNATLRFYVNGKTMHDLPVDLSQNNVLFNNKTSWITKTGNKIEFQIGSIKMTYIDNAVKDLAVTQMTFYFAQFGTKPPLANNGIYFAKLTKNRCETWQDIPNKFSSNDVVSADCRSGEIYLNGTPFPALGALGNDWEDFCLTPGLNQIGFSYSDWVSAAYAPKFKIRYREVFI